VAQSVSYRGMYAFADAWQLGKFPRSAPLRLLVWLLRNSDNETMKITRSQDRLGQELQVSARYVRMGLAYWKQAGVLKVLKHGGGTSRLSSEYQINLDGLKMYALRISDAAASKKRRTAEVQKFRNDGSNIATRNYSSSGVSGPTPEAHAVPELIKSAPNSQNSANGSGVTAQLRNKNDPTPEQNGSNSGSTVVPGTQRIRASEKQEDMGAAQSQTSAARRAGPANPTGQPARHEPLSATELDRKRQEMAELVDRLKRESGGATR
jgi:hypothetical protein